MRPHLIRIVAVLSLIVGSAATANVAAQVWEDCHAVDTANLKVYDDGPVLWKVRDITNDWTQSFKVQAGARRLADILRAYDVKTLCQRTEHGSRIMQYMLRADMKVLTGTALGGEKCIDFVTDAVRVEWSDEYKQFVLTDGKTDIITDWPKEKGNLSDVLSIIKKYRLSTRCRESYGPWGGNEDIEYWKGKPTVFTPLESARGRSRNPGGLADLKVVPPTYPLVCRGAADAALRTTDATVSANPEDATPDRKPERTFALKFRKAAGRASDGLAAGECSWMDRALNAAEPDQLVQQVSEGADSDPQHKWFTELRDPENYWTFDVYNDGKGRMIVTKARASAAVKPKPEGMAEWASLGGPVGSAPAGPAVVGGKDRSVMVFIKGTNGELWTRTFKTNKWITEWTSLGGALASAPAAATWDSQTIVVVARSTDNAIWSRRLYKGSWEAWTSLGGSSNYGPTITARGASRYEVFVVGNDNDIMQQSFNGSTASTWVSRGKVIRPSDEMGFVFAPVAISLGSRAIDVFAVGIDYQLYWKNWSETTGAWGFNWELLGGELRSAPAATMSDEGEAIIVARGIDSDVQKIIPKRSMMRTSLFNWMSLGGKLISQPAVISDSAGHLLVFGVGADNGLWWRSFPQKE